VTSPNRKPQKTTEGANGPETQLIAKAVRYSRLTLRDRLIMSLTLRELDRAATLTSITSKVPPAAFRRALRRPVGSRRRPVTVEIYGKPVSVLLNPQGRANPAREQELWDYLRGFLGGDEE